MNVQEPYLTVIRREYNPDYGDDRVCVCGHPYHRHFDGYDGNDPIGCKYCECRTFVENDESDGAKLARLEAINRELVDALERMVQAEYRRHEVSPFPNRPLLRAEKALRKAGSAVPLSRAEEEEGGQP